jgi:dinuclear metal center YbgI/SA1388 family protein
MQVPLGDLVAYLDSYLRIHEISDDPRALNGLQVSRDGEVSRIAAAVDACQATIDAAAARGADLLIVHHGLFWGGLRPLIGPEGRRVRALVLHRLALYAAHLPLDCHPEVGNNAVISRALELSDLVPFGRFDGAAIGLQGRCDLSRDQLLERITAMLGQRPRCVPGGPGRVRRVAVVSGAGSSALREAAAAGVDMLLTGEAPHHSFFEAEELGVNLVLGGHYATETFGVRALAAHVEHRFRIPWEFLDHPTGL